LDYIALCLQPFLRVFFCLQDPSRFQQSTYIFVSYFDRFLTVT